jgi:hypothetical protein
MREARERMQRRHERIVDRRVLKMETVPKRKASEIGPVA